MRKSLYEGRTRWHEQGRKKPSGPARIVYGPHMGILSIARVRCKLKQLCCYINPDFSVKKSDVSEHYEFDYPKIRKKKGKARWSYNNMYLLTELGRARRENIWPSFMALGPYAMTSGQIFNGPALPLSQ